MLELSVTEVERLLQEPSLFYADNCRPPADAHYLRFGKFFHMAMQTRPLFDLLYKPDMLPLAEHIKLVNLVKQNLPDDALAYELGVEHTCPERKVRVRGRIDRVGYDLDGGFVLADYKTTTNISSWNDWDHVFAVYHQWYIYPALFGLEFMLPLEQQITFEYRVTEKHKTKNVSEIVSFCYPLSWYLERFYASLDRIPAALELAEAAR